MVKINKQLLSQSASNVPGRTMTPKYITVHNTANTDKGANAKTHANYQSNGSGGRKASWHYQVDDKEIWQSLKDNQQGWHAGDGRGKGNTESIGIEICENSDGDFNAAVKNSQNLIKHLMDKHSIPLKNVVPHKHWSGKNCPRKLLDTWDEFISGIGTNKPKDTVKPPKVDTDKGKTNTKPSKPKANLTVDGKWGKSTTRALQTYLGTPVDGIISRQLRNTVSQSLYGNTVQFGTGGSVVIRSLQKLIGVKVDGLLGPATVRALQKYLLTTVDGKLSRPSLVVKALQRALNAGVL